jgi:hypothetical protein
MMDFIKWVGFIEQRDKRICRIRLTGFLGSPYNGNSKYRLTELVARAGDIRHEGNARF